MVTTPYDLTIEEDDGVPVLSDMDKAADAVAFMESRGHKNPYAAVGPKDRRGNVPIGKYQVMSQNIGPWTKKWLGRSMTMEEFKNSPQAQEAVFRGEFGSYVKRFGNFKDAASMWHSGRPLSQAKGRRDVLGTNTPDYVKKFDRLFNETGVFSTAGGFGGNNFDPNQSPMFSPVDMPEPQNPVQSLGSALGDAASFNSATARGSAAIATPQVPMWGGDITGGSLARIQRLRNEA